MCPKVGLDAVMRKIPSLCRESNHCLPVRSLITKLTHRQNKIPRIIFNWVLVLSDDIEDCDISFTF
jgi:hypothetical protein